MASERSSRARILLGWLAAALAGCAEGPLAGPEGGAGAAGAALASAPAGPAPGAPGCAAAVARLAGSPGAGRRVDEPASAPLALLEEPGREAPGLRLDLPVPTVRAPAETTAGCLMLVELVGEPAQRQTLARERIWSERAGPVERRANPEHEAARRELARLADRLDREEREQARDLRRLPPTGDVLVDALGLVGGLVLGGIGSLARDQELAAARERLAAIPAWLEVPRFEPYQLEASEVELVRRATVRLALLDRAAGRFWATSLPVVRSDRLRVAADLHPHDRGRLKGGGRIVAPADLEALAAAPPPVALSELLPPLRALLAGDPGRPGGAEAARLAWATDGGTRLAGGAAEPAGAGAGGALGSAPVRPPPALATGPAPIASTSAPGEERPRPPAVPGAALDPAAEPPATTEPAAAAGFPLAGIAPGAGPGPIPGDRVGPAAARAAGVVLAGNAPTVAARTGPAGGRLDGADEPGRARRAGSPGLAAVAASSAAAVPPAGGATAGPRPDGAGGAAEPPGDDRLRGARPPGPAGRPAPAGGAAEHGAASLVAVEGEGGAAHGFFVARDKVLTLARVLGGSSLARVETADGFRTWGVVALARPTSGLVVLHVPRPGRPLATADPASPPPPAGPLPAPGMPLLVDGRVRAVSLDPEEGRSADAGELAALLAGLEGR